MDSNHRPHAYQACALTTWAMRPFFFKWRWGESNSWPPACKAGALPAELHPHGAFFKAFSIVFSFSSAWKNVVGLTRLELVTSRLSGVRSNQLSYRPIFESHGSLKTEQYFEISDVRPTRS